MDKQIRSILLQDPDNVKSMGYVSESEKDTPSTFRYQTDGSLDLIFTCKYKMNDLSREMSSLVGLLRQFPILRSQASILARGYTINFSRVPKKKKKIKEQSLALVLRPQFSSYTQLSSSGSLAQALQLWLSISDSLAQTLQLQLSSSTSSSSTLALALQLQLFNSSS